MILFLYSIFLIALGMIAAATIIEARVPASIPYISKLKTYEEELGFCGIILGFFGVFGFVFNMGYYLYEPVNGLLELASSLLMFGIGLILGVIFISKRLRDPAVSFPILPRIEAFRARLLPYRKTMGEAAIVCGVITILFYIVSLF